MTVHITLVPCTHTKNYAFFHRTGQTAQIATEICQRFICGAMLWVCCRDDEIKLFVFDGAIRLVSFDAFIVIDCLP